MAETEKKSTGRRGRPPSKVPLPKRVNVMFRLTEMTRGKLMRLAEEAGRSMSEELEFRTEQSIQKDVRLYALTNMLGGKDMLMFATLMCGEMKLAIESANSEINSENNWFDDDNKIKHIKQRMSYGASRAIDTFANLVRTGTAARSGDHMLEERDGFEAMHPEQVTEAIIRAYSIQNDPQ